MLSMLHCRQIRAMGRAAATCLAFSCAQSSVAADRTISYVESSSGLAQPAMEAGSTELEFSDVNGDGHIDIVCVGDHGSPYINTSEHGVMVWFGDGAGSWSVFQYGNFGYGGLALGDVNNDGLMDVGYGMHHNYSSVDLGDQILEVALGDGTGQYWEAWDDGLATNGETWGMFGTDFADFDSDGDLDVGSIGFGSGNGVHIYRNNGDGTWTQTFAATGGNSDLIFVFGEINGDGFIDFACGGGQGGGSYEARTVYLGDGTGGFTLDDGNLPPATNYRRGASLGDVNNDGRDDLSFASNSGVGVYTWIAPGQWGDLSGNLASVGQPDLTEIVDLDLDGFGDVIALYASRLDVYLGDGQGNWQLIQTITMPDACDTAALRAGTDFDHNGYPDFAFIVEDDCQPWVGGTNTLFAFAEASVPAVPSLYHKYPRGGETFIAGSVRFIDWHAAVPDSAEQPTMTLALSVTGSDGPFQTVASDVPNNGRHQWTVPTGTQTSDECYLRLTLNTDPPISMITPDAFTIQVIGCPGDINGDNVVNVTDLLMLLGAWGTDGPGSDLAEPLDIVNVSDLLVLLGAWGECP